MARRARIIAPGYAYHVTQRANRGEAVFKSPADRKKYLELLRHYTGRYGLRVWNYCLMMNHVHLVVRADQPLSLIRGIGVTHRCYTQWFNKQYTLAGHLWASRYFSTPLDERHLWCAARYVELNPVRAGIVEKPQDYPWSSARSHVEGAADPLLCPSRPFPGAVPDWAAFLGTGLSADEEKYLRRNTYRGYASGSADFTAALEKELARTLAVRPCGRPRKDLSSLPSP